MEQEEMMREYYRNVKVTGAFLLKAMAIALKGGYDGVKNSLEKQKNKPLNGEQPLKKLISSNSKIDMQNFENSELNLNKLKEHLKSYQIAFHFKKNQDGTTDVLFESKNSKLVEASVNNVLQDIITDPKKATDKLSKKESDLKPSEQIVKHKEELQSVKKSSKKKSKMKGKTL